MYYLCSAQNRPEILSLRRNGGKRAHVLISTEMQMTIIALVRIEKKRPFRYSNNVVRVLHHPDPSGTAAITIFSDAAMSSQTDRVHYIIINTLGWIGLIWPSSSILKSDICQLWIEHLEIGSNLGITSVFIQ